MIKTYGRAYHCQRQDCKGISVKFNWALLSGKEYEYNRDNYIQLCKSCHSKMDVTDETRRKISVAFKGKKWSDERKQRFSQLVKGAYERPNQWKPVYHYDEDGKLVSRYSSVKAAAQCLGLHPKSVASARRGDRGHRVRDMYLLPSLTNHTPTT